MPAREQLAGWRFWLAETPTMTNIGEFTKAVSRSLTVTLNRPGSASCLVHAEDPLFDRVAEVSTSIVAIRDDQVRWSGPVWTSTASASGRTKQVQAVGWFEGLRHRVIRRTLKAAVGETGGDPILVARPGDFTLPGIFSTPGAGGDAEPGTLYAPLVWNNYDAGAVAKYLLELANRKAETRITVGAVATTQPRSGTYDPIQGQYIGDIILELSNLESGFDFVIHPETREMTIYAKKMADLRGDVTFAYGASAQNLLAADRSRDASRTCNWMMAFSSEDGQSRYVEDTLSQTELGLVFEEVQSLTGLTQPNPYTEAADPLLAFVGGEVAVRAYPRESWQITPKPWSYAKNASDQIQSVPRLFEDYDVGDLVSLDVDPPTDSNGNVLPGISTPEGLAVRIFGVSINIDENGNETITNVQTSPDSG